jgi:hypothetical protein
MKRKVVTIVLKIPAAFHDIGAFTTIQNWKTRNIAEEKKNGALAFFISVPCETLCSI